MKKLLSAIFTIAIALSSTTVLTGCEKTDYKHPSAR